MGHFSFGKEYRILKRSEFIRLSKYGGRIKNDNFLALFSRSNAQCSRLGVTVTKKIGNAVKRNRIKRQIRECFRHNRPQFIEYLDINIIALKKADVQSNRDMRISLDKLFDRLTRTID